MQIKTKGNVTEEHISMIDKLPLDCIFTKNTGLEEVNLVMHKHNRYQIIYIISGTLHIETDNANYFVTSGNLAWIPEGTMHRLSSNNRQIAIITVYFHLSNKKDDKLAIYRSDELVIRNLQLINSFNKINKNTAPELFCFSISFFRLIPLICSKSAFSMQPFYIIKDNRLPAVMEYIRNNLNQDLSIEKVASYFGFSVRNLTRIFTKSGISFIHFLNYHRIVRSIEIMTDNPMNIEQTAYEVGFNSPNSFSRVFKQMTGESPLAYMRKHKSMEHTSQ